MALMERGNKITFANQLRGIAVLCVIVAHYTGIYWGAPDLVSMYIHAPPVVGGGPRWAQYITFPTLNYGPFGVALFFLISGFVIPFSLGKMGPVSFIVARVLRIFPTFWAATALMLAITWLSSQYWGLHAPLNGTQLLANLLLVHGEMSLPTVDLVNWTLAVEVRFYIAAALMWPFIRRSSVLGILNLTLCILAFLSWTPVEWGLVAIHGVPISLDQLKTDLLYIPFLFIGTLFNFALKGDISTRTLWASAAAVFLMFSMMWQKTVMASQFWQVPANYGYALIVFSGCYAIRARFKASRLFDFFADISYPLYLVHAVIGYTTIRYLTAQGLRFTVAAACAFLFVVLIAYLLHISIEVTSAKLGKRLGTARKRKVTEPPPVALVDKG